MLILARTTPLEQVARRTDGLSLFYTDLDRRFVDVREIPKMGRSAVDSNELFIDALPVPVADRIGEEGKGFEYILHGMNPERILIGAEGIGLGRAALRKAASYAKERIVFDRPIGQNQAIQHPLAACWMALEAANLMAFKAASLYDAGLPCGVEANAAKYLAGEACFKACETALMTHGGMGYAKEFHVERYLRESLIVRIAPITPHLILSFIAEKALGLPEILLARSPVSAERSGAPVVFGLAACGGRCAACRGRAAARTVRHVFRDHGRVDRGDGVVRQAVPDLVHPEQRDAEIAADGEHLSVTAEIHLRAIHGAVARIEDVAIHIVQALPLHVPDEGHAEHRLVLPVVGAAGAKLIGRISAAGETPWRWRPRRCRPDARRTGTRPPACRCRPAFPRDRPRTVPPHEHAGRRSPMLQTPTRPMPPVLLSRWKSFRSATLTSQLDSVAP